MTTFQPQAEAPPGASVLTVDQAAADLQTEPARLWAWHRAGRLEVLYLAGEPVGDRRGTKDGRITIEEWARFKRSLAVTIVPEMPPVPASEPPRKGRPVGSRKAPGSDLLGDWRGRAAR